MAGRRSAFTAVSLFSGAGGMDLGFINAGFKVLWANDMDKWACDTYRSNIDDHVVCGPIDSPEAADIPAADVVFGGPPCQGFSVAGRMDPADPRSKLIWEFMRVVRETRPAMFVMENVAALAKLAKFAHIRAALVDRYRDIGYRAIYKVLSSKDYEVAQNRQRMIMIGTRVPEISIQYPPACDHEITTREAIEDLGEPGTGINQGICKARITIAQHPVYRKSPYAGMLFNGLGRPIDLERPAPTLPATMGGNKTPILETNLLKNPRGRSWVKKHHAMVGRGEKFDAYSIKVPKYLRRLTVREAARIQGFPDDFAFSGSQSQQFKQIGNAVPPKLAEHIARVVSLSLQGRSEMI